ncbi:MAG: alpha/beta hydrolase [Prevotellaceae bacterium]|nr:alpha/beta hydrolase [Prevotellaceae bacterium]
MRIKLFFIAAILCLMASVAKAQKGSWSGELNIQGIKLPLVFNFTDDGCTIDSPSQGAKGIKAEKSITPEGKLKVTAGMIGASFEGTMEEQTITGTFTQNGMSLPLTLKPGEQKNNRPQTPVPPFPYITEEVTFSNGDITLNGTLTLPEGWDKNTKAVVMVTGSGQQNRDEEIFDHKPFAVIADALARKGIASLRYDDRGWGNKAIRFTDFTTDDFKQDAAAGIDLLRRKFKTVGVIGHSEGGTIALMLASEGKTDFVVSLAGMTISGKQTLLNQNIDALRSIGLQEETVEKYSEVISDIFDKVAAGQDIDEYLKGAENMENFKPIIDHAKKLLTSPYMRHFITKDIHNSLPNIKCPVLALNGKKDTQVEYKQNLEVLENGLTNCSHETVAYDNLNHLFQHCTNGSIVEYHQIEETISQEVLDKIISWIK